MNIFQKIFGFPFRKIHRKAARSKLSAEKNRKHVGRNLFFIAIGVFAIFIFRFVWLITTNHVAGVNLTQMAQNNYESTVTVQAKRGTIYDRNGVPIAVDSSNYTLYVVLDKTQKATNGTDLFCPPSDFGKLAKFLHDKLGIDETLAETQLNQKGAKQVQFGTNGSNISLSKMEAVQKEALNEGLTGLGFTPSLARSYPNKNFASQFIGIASPVTDKNGNTTLVGQNGLEASYNSLLSGQNGEETYQKDIAGRPLPGTTKTIKPVVNGQDIYTTLDAQLQEHLETLMDTAAKNTGAEQLSATLMDAHTGQILATTQRPTFTPTTVSQDSKQANFTWNSQLYQNTYEPGSTMKTFLMASALDSDKVNLNATYQRTLSVYDVDINDWDINEYGSFQVPEYVTFAQGFEMSSNVGMSKIQMNMGNTLWDQYLNKFRFGVPTRLGMGGEQFGAMPSTNPVSQIQSAFGQGISVTQIQLLRGWTAFANGGEMLEPHIIDKLVNTNTGTQLTSNPEVIGHPVSSSAVSQVRQLMVGVNTDPIYGTAYLNTKDGNPLDGHQDGPLFMVNGQSMAVKTGTAQIASPTGGYLQGQTAVLASAVAMYPANNPDFIFYFNDKMPDNSSSTVYASDVANAMMAQAESEKDSIDATSNVSDFSAGKVKISDYKGQDPGTTADSLRQTLLAPVVIGQGTKIVAQSVKSDSQVPANTRILLLTDGNSVMPDMYGWSKDQVEQVAKWYDLTVDYHGNGDKVTGQSATAQQPIKKGSKITIDMG